MSRENVELVRATLEAYKNPDMISGLASGELDLQLVDPEIEWDASRLTEMVPDLAGVYRGHEGVRSYWRRWFEAWSHLEFDFELRDAGEEVVVLVRNQRQWGRHTGICTELPPYAQVFTMHEGKLVRWRTFPDQESALKAVGLDPGASESMDLVRSIFANWERGHYSAVEWADQQIEFVIADLPDLGTSKGVTGMAEGWREFLSAWEGHRVEAEEYRELDGERVLVLGRLVARGRISGLDVRQMRTEGANVFHIRDRKVIRLVIYFDRDRALADLGFTPEASDRER